MFVNVNEMQHKQTCVSGNDLKIYLDSLSSVYWKHLNVIKLMGCGDDRWHLGAYESLISVAWPNADVL